MYKNLIASFKISKNNFDTFWAITLKSTISKKDNFFFSYKKSIMSYILFRFI